MTDHPEEQSFMLQSQPSFNFEPFGNGGQYGFGEPSFGEMHLISNISTAKPNTSPATRTNLIYRRKIKRLENKVKKLEKQLRSAKNRSFLDAQGKGNSSLDNNPPIFSREEIPKIGDPNSDCLADIQQQQEAIAGTLLNQHHPINTSINNLEFQQFQITPHPPETEQLELNGQSWIVMGMLMMVMGININGYDGTIDAYKITRETVDSIRKQVEKSCQQITFPIFYSKLFSIEGSAGMESVALDGCFELEGLRLESINEQDLMFQEHLNFKLKYEALIVMMEYMKQYAFIE